jgi:hypothetical protein
MTRRHILIGVTVLAAVALTASTALAGEPTMRGRGDFPQAGDSAEAAALVEPQKRGLSDFGHISRASDRAQPRRVEPYPDAIERAVNAKLAAQSNVSRYPDALDRAIAERGSVAAPRSTSGRQIEWPPLAIGFAVGIASVLCLRLAVRLTRSRPLARG